MLTKPHSPPCACRLAWSYALPDGMQVPGWHQPVLVDEQGLVASSSNRSSRRLPGEGAKTPLVLLLGQVVGGRRRGSEDGAGSGSSGGDRRGGDGGGSSSSGGGGGARLFALDLGRGQLAWSVRLNGTARAPSPPDGPAAPPLVAAGAVVVESCLPGVCCLKAVALATGEAGWELCMPAQAGADATHARAQFAIWLVMLTTFSAISALVLGACFIYSRAWLAELYQPQGFRLQLMPMPDGNDDWHPPYEDGSDGAAAPPRWGGSGSFLQRLGLGGTSVQRARMPSDDSPPLGYF